MNNTEQETKPVRVRIAPSPTGNLHVGTARTAIFNELYAHHTNGSFIIRIEDTDPKRSEAKYEQNILEGLKWLGLTWHEGPDIGGEFGPYRQSERAGEHQKALEQLLESGKAYYCTCVDREGSCSCKEQSLAAGVIRLSVEAKEVSFQDIVRGTVTVHTDSFGRDFVIARSINDPLFHMAVVCDDEAMKITHVIRGEDHLHNTIKHILIQEALGYARPIYAHLPLLLDEQRKKLSKRSGETSLLAYKEMGYLPQAMLNYLALLGWNNGDDREFYTHEDLIKAFSLERVQKGGAIFSIKKLSAINKKYVSELSDEELLAWGLYHYAQHNIEVADTQRFLRALKVERTRFSSYESDGIPLYTAMNWYESSWESSYDDVSLIFKTPKDAFTPELKEKTRGILTELIALLTDLEEENFTAPKLQEFIMHWIDTNEKGRGDVLWPMRVALTGKANSAGPFEVGEVIGKSDIILRLQNAHESLN